MPAKLESVNGVRPFDRPKTGRTCLCYAGGMFSSRLLEPALALLVFAVVAAVYLSGRDVATVTDSRWTLYLAESLVRSGDLNLDEYRSLVRTGDAYTLTRAGGHLHSYFPIGAALAAVPYMAVLDRLAPALWGIDLYAYLQQAKFDPFVAQLELTWASVIAAAAAAVVYLAARQKIGRARSVLLAGIFAFGTAAWSTASRALWQHGPSMLLLAIALYLALCARTNERVIRFLGAILALACITRPTNVVVLAVFALYVALYYRRQLAGYLLGAGVVALLFVVYSLSVFGTVLPDYYRAGRLALHPDFGTALAGNLVSPGRGLLVYSPVFLLCAYGVWLSARWKHLAALTVPVVLALLLHWIVISLFPHWWGGHAYGPRYFTDVTPFLVFLLIPVLAELRTPSTTSEGTLPALVAFLFAVSVFMHYRGANDLATWRWNWPIPRVLTPEMDDTRLVEDVDKDPARLWDWRDPPFLRGLRAVQPAVLSAALTLQVEPASGQREEAQLTILNVGDGLMDWEAVASPGIRLPVPPNDEARRIHRSLWPVEPFQPQTLVLWIDTAELGPGVHEVGDVVVRGLPADRRRVRNGEVRVPVRVIAD